MQKIRDIIRKISRSDYLPYIYMVLILTIVHCFIKVNNYDDVTYATLLTKDSNIFAILYSRYLGWSSRVIIEFFLLLIVKYSLLWKLIDILMYVLLAYSISDLLPEKQNRYKNFIVVTFLLLYPLGEMDSAGWCATSTGYFWTIALGCYGLLAAKKVIKSQKIQWYEYILYSLAILYASNHEQMAFCLLGIYTCIIFHQLFSHKKTGFLWIQVGIIVIEFVFIILSPGNAARKNLTLIQVRPDYSNVSIAKLLYEAYADTMNYFIFHGNILFFLLAVMIMVSVFYKCRDWYIRVFVCIPPIYLILAKMPFHIIPEFLLRRLTAMNLENAVSRKGYFSIVISAMLLGIMLAGIFLIYENTRSFWINAILLGIGLCSRMVIGTTGSAFGSSYRTIIFFEMGIAIVLMNLSLYSEKKINRKWINILLVTLILITIGKLCYHLVIFDGSIPLNM